MNDASSRLVTEMTVVHIVTALDNGGAQAVLWRLCAAERQAGCRHAVITLMGPGHYFDRLKAVGVEVYCLDMPRGRVTVRGLLRLFRLLRRLRPSVVQTWMYHADLVGGLVARLAGIKAIVWGIRGPLNEENTSRSTRAVAQLCARLSRSLPSRVISCSAYAAEVHKGLGYQASKIVVIPNGYQLEHFAVRPDEGSALRTALGLKAGVPLVGMVARFDAHKDHANLLAALNRLKQRGIQVNCLLVGDEMVPQNDRLQKLVAQEGVDDCVKLLGPRTDVRAIMNALDIHVLSSVAEAFPNVLGEAMACGTPCVATNVGDAALILGDTGWIVPPRNSAALADAVEKAVAAMGDQDSWRQRGTACRERIRTKFSLESMCTEFHRVWSDALEAVAIRTSAS